MHHLPGIENCWREQYFDPNIKPPCGNVNHVGIEKSQKKYKTNIYQDNFVSIQIIVAFVRRSNFYLDH